MPQQIRQPNLPNTSKDAVARAREQAKAYDSFFAPTTLELDDGSTIELPPHPQYQMLDDDRMEAYEDLLFEEESCDRHPDVIVPEHELRDKKGVLTGEIVPAETIRGALIEPLRRTVDGVTKLVKPPHSIRVVQACLGEDEYKRLVHGGKSAADVWRLWGRQALEVGLLRGDRSLTEALWIWRQYPSQIASDLSQFHNRSIKEWHDATMSSYELLELVEHMDDRGAYKTALRGGELCPSDEMLRNLHNEVAMLRATMQAVHGGQQYSPKIFESISERRERVEKEESVAEGRENFYSLADRSTRVNGQVDFDDAEARS